MQAIAFLNSSFSRISGDAETSQSAREAIDIVTPLTMNRWSLRIFESTLDKFSEDILSRFKKNSKCKLR